MFRYSEIAFKSADDLWEALSPTRNLGIEAPYDLLYRGQGDANWSLIPSALREPHASKTFYPSELEQNFSRSVVLDELLSLSEFVLYCDRIGIAIPNDSQLFRSVNIGTGSPASLDYLANPSKWPNPQLLDLMALAQHHGMPTRLLDWTSLAYTACYFASSTAIANFENWSEDSKLAIWVLDISRISSKDFTYVFRAPGSISPNLAAQYGKFTVHPHNSELGNISDVKGLEDIISIREHPILFKLTLPSNESARLLGLCSKAGFSAADIYPSTDGAGIAVRDSRNVNSARYHYARDGRKGISFSRRKQD